ncbi:hypothetical protein BvCmsNSP079_04871 [Escherichia coli]|nr:hypothetical protein BvCmsNSP079_04871 [Escherichia coli]
MEFCTQFLIFRINRIYLWLSIHRLRVLIMFSCIRFHCFSRCLFICHCASWLRFFFIILFSFFCYTLRHWSRGATAGNIHDFWIRVGMVGFGQYFVQIFGNTVGSSLDTNWCFFHGRNHYRAGIIQVTRHGDEFVTKNRKGRLIL